MLWDRGEQGRFPQPKELKQMIRDKVAPSKYLGHSDTIQLKGVDTIDDDEAEELRKYFGVM
jgi:predicted Rdx family selenoprotein